MANTWFRVYAEFATDPKVQMMSESDQRRLLMLMCLRCNGDVTLQDSEVAFQLRITVDDWLMTKSMFIDRGFIDTSNKLLNWDKRQFASDSSTERVARHRARKKVNVVDVCNVPVTPQNRTEQNRTDTELKDNIEKVKKTKVNNINFSKPSLQEITDFCLSKNYNIDPETFFAHYESNGWVVGQAKAKMKCWKSAVVTWAKRDSNRANNETNKPIYKNSGQSNSAVISGIFDKNLKASVAHAVGRFDFQEDARDLPEQVDFTISH